MLAVTATYSIVAQRSAGPDGISYRAADLAGNPVELRMLTPVDGDRAWPRERRLRLARLLEAPGAQRLRQVDLDSEHPQVVLDWLEGPDLLELIQSTGPQPADNVLALVAPLADAVAAAHRFGLLHGKISPRQIFRAADGSYRLDFTRLDVGQTQSGAEHCPFEQAARPPELESLDDTAIDFACDVFGLGTVILSLLSGRPAEPCGPGAFARQWLGETLPVASDVTPADSPLAQLVERMLARDPNERPNTQEVQEKIAALTGSQSRTLARSAESSVAQLVGTLGSISAAPEFDELVGPTDEQEPAELVTGSRLGRFTLLEKLGQGGMGAVFRAIDPVTEQPVAIKTLRAEWSRRPEAIRRFHKEARLLAEVNNPYVANLIEVNVDAGIHYLVMEFVEGESLAHRLSIIKKLDERTALSIAADVARALIDAHARGIVHRDIKPENILLASLVVQAPLVVQASRLPAPPVTPASPSTPTSPPRVKLTDFGIARHVVESESLALTQEGSLLGTPLYMSPEQCGGTAPVDVRSDIYSLGATLFQMLAGRPPFVAATSLGVISMHCSEPAPPLASLDATLSPAACQIVEKCLAKSPDQRYAHAAALVEDLDRVLRGEPTSASAHPKLPDCDPKNILHYDFLWELESSPEQLWPHVSNTERLNRAIGLPAAEFKTETNEEGVVERFGRFRAAGFENAWQEHPYEWIEGKRLGVLRVFHEGPFHWFTSSVELSPRSGGGTLLTHRIRVEPRGLFGRTVAAVKLGSQGKRSLATVYRRIDAALRGKLGSAADLFEEPPALTPARKQRLDRLLDTLSHKQLDPAVLERLGEFVARAPAQEVARIRPLALAARFNLPGESMVAACLHGAHQGLLVLMWDILCPICRIPSEVKETLRELREHGRCEACNLDFKLDFANSVEMIFRAHPELRDNELGTYCIGGPQHSPHVAAQIRIGPGEWLPLELSLPEGSYRLRGPQLPYSLDLRVEPGALSDRLDVPLARPMATDLVRRLSPGRQLLEIVNDFSQELVVRIERTASRGDALTAARASASAVFRQLFPGEVLSSGQLISVSTVTFLATDLADAGDLYEQLGDARAFAAVHELLRQLDAVVRRHGGAVVKTVGEGVLAVFPETANAVRAAIDLPAGLAASDASAGSPARLRAAVHRGPAMAATLNDHLDYFGATVNLAVELVRMARGGELIYTHDVAVDPQTREVLANVGPADLLPAVVGKPVLYRLQRS